MAERGPDGLSRREAARVRNAAPDQPPFPRFNVAPSSATSVSDRGRRGATVSLGSSREHARETAIPNADFSAISGSVATSDDRVHTACRREHNQQRDDTQVARRSTATAVSFEFELRSGCSRTACLQAVSAESTSMANPPTEGARRTTSAKVGGAMKEYENIRRGPDELLRAFIARFLKVEQRMSRVGLRPFTDEARGWKLLHSCQLTGHDMRNVLTAAGNQYDFDAIRRALELQFPGAPPAHSRQPGRKGGKDGKDGKGGKGGKAPRQVYEAAIAEEIPKTIAEGDETGGTEPDWQIDAGDEQGKASEPPVEE
eukprot:939616-Amphidinium_carterae.1